jgi:hypothetical protein
MVFSGKNISKMVIITVCIFVYSCIDPFSPPEVNTPEKYLVVDGFLNMSKDTSKIELRRTQNAQQQSLPVVEPGAKVSVENEQGTTYPFTERGNGVYTLVSGTLNKALKYRLNITTRNGQQYVSEFVQVTRTPPIDSVTYKYDKFLNAMLIKVNTHDPTNEVKFYRWKFEDTYEYFTPYFSGLEVIGKELVGRRENINQCWKSSVSANIILGSTVKLSRSEIRDLPVHVVPVLTNKLLVKYSILVKQYGLTQTEFEYWTNLSKTTQSTGSLFDPQPSQVTGNIKNKANPKELVFGYFGATEETEKRIFMTPRLGYYETCVIDTLPVACPSPEIECVFNTNKLLITYISLTDVTAVPPSCADCRLQGGTIVRPEFWE